MLQVGRHLDFPKKSVGAERCSQLGPKHLDGDRPVMPTIPGQVDRRHATLADLALDGIPPLEGCAYKFKRIDHGGALISRGDLVQNTVPDSSRPVAKVLL